MLIEWGYYSKILGYVEYTDLSTGIYASQTWDYNRGLTKDIHESASIDAERHFNILIEPWNRT